MKRFKNIIILMAGLSALPAFSYVYSVLQDVGTTMDEVKRQTLYQIGQDHFSTYYTGDIKDACKKLPIGVREATMMSLGKVIRDYVESPQFQTDYTQYLNTTYPQTPYTEDSDLKQQREQKITSVKASLENAQMLQMIGQTLDMDIQAKESMLKMFSDPNLKSVTVNNPAFSEDGMKKDIADDKVLKDLYAKDPKAFKQKYAEVMTDREIAGNINQRKADNINNNKRAQDEIDKRKDYKAHLKIQLQEFIDGTADVDFTAALKANEYGQKVFVNPDYEAKDGQWKFYFRCGKESITGARKFAQGWLSSLK